MVVGGENHVGAVATDCAGDVASEGGTVFDDAVLVVKELDGVNADGGGAAFFFPSRRGPTLSGCIPLMPASPLVTSR